MPLMTLTYMRSPDNKLLADLGQFPLQPGQVQPPLSLMAQATFPDASEPGGLDSFLFWNVNDEIFSSLSFSLATIPSNDFTATAWYAGGGAGPPTVITFAFSTDQNKTLPLPRDVPIQSVSPAGSPPWDGSSNVVFNTNTEVKITAKSQVPDDTLPFFGWTKLGDQDKATAAGAVLTVPAGQFCLAFANYGVDPCLSIKQQLAAVQEQLRLPDLPPGARNALLKQEFALLQALKQCEQLHS